MDDFLNDCYSNAYHAFYKGQMQETCKFIVEAVNYCRTMNYEVPLVFTTMSVMVIAVDKQGEMRRDMIPSDYSSPQPTEYTELLERLPDLNEINV